MSEILRQIREIVGPGGLLCGEDVASRVAEWGKSEPCRAMAIVRPKSTEEVAAVLKLCNEAGQPIVPQGGMTGLVRGGYAEPNEIGLSLERMNQIEEIDTASGTITVQAGVPMQKVQEAAADNDLLFPVDLGARGTASIGGNISTNAGGNQVIRYGMMRDSVLGVEAVLADGTVLSSLNKLIKNNAGYDIKQYFIGTEGTLGIVTRAVLRLRARPISVNTAFLGVDSFENVVSVLRRMEQTLGGTLSSFEVMWKEFYEGMTAPPATSARPIPAEHEYYILMEAQGADQEADDARFQSALEACFEDGLIANAAVAQSESDSKAFWGIRDAVAEMREALGGPPISFDVSLPIPEMPDYIAKIRSEIADKCGDYNMFVFGHLGDGNLHVSATVYDEEKAAKRRVEDIVYSNLKSINGSISAEHGIGLAKKDHLHLSRTSAELAVMRQVKGALDPKNILNPGKVF